jgi:hypothetical protein
MVKLLRAANIPVAVGTMPPCPAIDSYRLNLALVDEFTDQYYPPAVPGVTLIGYGGTPTAH